MKATAESRMTASRLTLTPLFDLSRCQKGGPLFFRCGKLCIATWTHAMPENPELLNDVKFENGSSPVSGDSSQERRSDCERNVSNHSEHNKLKISRGDHPQRSSHYVENQVMVKSPSCWIDPVSSETRQTTHNETHKNSGTNATRYLRIETSCTLAWR